MKILMLAFLLLISSSRITSTVGLRGGIPHRLADLIRAAECLRSARRLLSVPLSRGAGPSTPDRCATAAASARPHPRCELSAMRSMRVVCAGGLRPAGNVTKDDRPGSKSANYRVDDRALSGCEAGVSVGSALWRFAARFGPGLWPGPRRQARWAGRGFQGQRRAAGASRAAGCEAPLRLEEPARTMRGVPARWLWHSFGDWRTLREGDRPAVVLAGAAAGYGGDRGRPVTGVPCAAAAASTGLASEGRGESCRPATARPPGEPRPPTAGHPDRSYPLIPCVRRRCLWPGPSGPARRRRALD